MGMFSYFEHEDIEVNDWEGLLKFFKFWDNFVKKEYSGWEEMITSKTMLNEKDKTISFECWNEIKLISYWYDVQLLFLELVAEYISGNVKWDFECDDETGFVDFENGICNITTGVMKYVTSTPMNSLRDINFPIEIKKMLMLKKMKGNK